jgi:ribonuclease VapC
MSHVLDASALLALLNDEPGAPRVEAALGDALICAVNLAEVGTKLIESGGAPRDVRQVMRGLGLTLVDFGEGLAWASADLRAKTRAAGLSLADRACLALAIREGATALTADRAWAKLDLDCDVELIR